MNKGVLGACQVFQIRTTFFQNFLQPIFDRREKNERLGSFLLNTFFTAEVWVPKMSEFHTKNDDRELSQVQMLVIDRLTTKSQNGTL